MVNNFRQVSLEEFDSELDPNKNHSFLIKKYKEGLSRYINNKGFITWKKCEILSYCDEQMLFTIKWKDSGIIKKVKRLNLVYGKDDIEEIDNRRLKANVVRCDQL